MMSFLDRIYDYDNLSQYSVLLDQPWLSQTLQDLKAGEMTITDFAALSLEQREIVTQALFYHLNPDALQSLFDAGNGVIVEPILPDPIMTGEVIQTGSVIDTGSIVDTGAKNHTLELGDKILQWLGLHNKTPDVVTGDMAEPPLTGDIDLTGSVVEEKFTL